MLNLRRRLASLALHACPPPCSLALAARTAAAAAEHVAPRGAGEQGVLRSFAIASRATSAAPAAAAAALPRPWELPRSPKPVTLPQEALVLAERTASPASRRTGLVAVKCGMTCDWTPWGDRLPLTVLWLDDVQARRLSRASFALALTPLDRQVVQLKTEEKEGFYALQVGAGSRKAKQATAPLAGHFAAAGVPIKRRLTEFRVTRDALLPVGTPLLACHFVAGQKVDVRGVSGGKGFAGGMKRHGFSGQGASHGNSVSHRALGSTGNRQDPGRVWKGKKMPGRLGGATCSVHSLLVYKVDAERGLLYVKGAVPGHAGCFVEVRDALRERPSDAPFPTHVGAVPGVSVAPRAKVNPFEVLQPERHAKKKAD